MHRCESRIPFHHSVPHRGYKTRGNSTNKYYFNPVFTRLYLFLFIVSLYENNMIVERYFFLLNILLTVKKPLNCYTHTLHVILYDNYRL